MRVQSYQVNGLGSWLCFLTAPGFTPEPVLGQGLDGDRMDHIVGQVLVQIGEGVGVLGQSLVLASQPISSCHLAKRHKVHQVESADVISPVTKVILPVALIPESECKNRHSIM